MSQRQVKCESCRRGDWEASDKECRICVGYSRWEKNLKPRAIYMGHRKDATIKIK